MLHPAGEVSLAFTVVVYAVAEVVGGFAVADACGEGDVVAACPVDDFPALGVEAAFAEFVDVGMEVYPERYVQAVGYLTDAVEAGIEGGGAFLYVCAVVAFGRVDVECAFEAGGGSGGRVLRWRAGTAGRGRRVCRRWG